MAKRKSQEEVIRQFKEVHGGRYDYSKVVYVKNEETVIICCSIHGEFPQTPNKHKQGKGCRHCANLKRGMKGHERAKKNLISDFKQVHGDRYNYTKVDYIGKAKNVIITCKIHGDFPQTPDNHKKGKGCPHCANLKKSETMFEKTKTTLLEDFKKVHGDFYIYDKVIYTGSDEDVIITCPKHGDFEQRPNNHKMGKGCRICGAERIAKSRQLNPAGWTHSNWQNASEVSKNFDSFKVYIIKCYEKDEEFYKIGKTFTTIKYRFKGKHSMPYKYKIILEEVFPNAKLASIREKELQEQNRDYKYLPKLDFDGRYECFSKIICTI